MALVLVFSFALLLIIDVVIIPMLSLGSDVFIAKPFVTTFLLFVLVPGLIIVHNDSMMKKLLKVVNLCLKFQRKNDNVEPFT